MSRNTLPHELMMIRKALGESVCLDLESIRLDLSATVVTTEDAIDRLKTCLNDYLLALALLRESNAAYSNGLALGDAQ